MFELMSVKPMIENQPDAHFLSLSADQADITFEDICFQYVQGKQILNVRKTCYF